MLTQNIFNREKIRKKRDKIAKNINNYNFIHKIVAKELFSRIEPINVKLRDILIFGAHSKKLCNLLSNKNDVENIFLTDLSLELLKYDSEILSDKCHLLVADEEFLPFKENSLDLAVSNLTYHSVNDLKGALIQLNNVLKPNRPILFSIFSAGNIENIKKLSVNIESEIIGGAYIRIAPFVDIKTIGDLLQNTGFNQIVIDSDKIDIKYSSFKNAIQDIRNMGEGSILFAPTAQIRKDVYKKMEDDFLNKEQGNVTVKILYAIAWK